MAFIYPNKDLPWSIPYEAVKMIAESEGFRSKAYQCVAGVWTIGWGETVREDGRPVTSDLVWEKSYADERFCKRLRTFTEEVRRALPMVDLNPNEMGALVSLCYNIGLGQFQNSTVRRCLLKEDKIAASRAFRLFNKATIKGTKQVIPALERRRARESALFLTPYEMLQVVTEDETATPEPKVPQVVAPEEKPIESSTNQVAAVGGIAGVLALLPQVSATLKEVANNLGVDPVTALGIVIVAGSVYLLYKRHKRRLQGWV